MFSGNMSVPNKQVYVCVPVSGVPGIPFLYEWVPYHFGWVFFFFGWVPPPPPPPSGGILVTLRLRVPSGLPMTNMH